MKQKTFVDKFNAIQKIGAKHEVPWEHARFLDTKYFDVSGADISISNAGDFGSIQQVRAAVGYVVNQLGGTVKWSVDE